MEYTKLPLTLSQQIERLHTRGLKFADIDSARVFLNNVNYYRLSAFFIPFQSQKDSFIPGTTFDEIINLYQFDQKLRTILFKALEIVEISFRTRITLHLALKYGAFAQASPACFAQSFRHARWYDAVKNEISRSKETFIDHYRNKYLHSPDFPIWILIEGCSFGSLSLMYAGMKNEDKDAIAEEFTIHRSVLKTWLHTMVYIRNTCAHHARLWNREIAIKPEFPDSNPAFSELRMIRRHKIFSALSVIHFCLRIITAKHSLRTDLVDVFNEFSFTRLHAAGFPPYWDSLSLWKDRS
jgi:abortive infection bacteriophage resistance protein